MTDMQFVLVIAVGTLLASAGGCAVSAWWQRNSARLDQVIRDAHIDPGRYIGRAQVIGNDTRAAVAGLTSDQLVAEIVDLWALPCAPGPHGDRVDQDAADAIDTIREDTP